MTATSCSIFESVSAKSSVEGAMGFGIEAKDNFFCLLSLGIKALHDGLFPCLELLCLAKLSD